MTKKNLKQLRKNTNQHDIPCLTPFSGNIPMSPHLICLQFSYLAPNTHTTALHTAVTRWMFQMRRLTLFFHLAWCGPPLMEALLCFFTNYTNALFIITLSCNYEWIYQGLSTINGKWPLWHIIKVLDKSSLRTGKLLSSYDFQTVLSKN